jgi:CRISPR/Cas system-associated exonuclease Cas4 (RecB family)
VRTLRASEIGSFLYCQRAWWYQKQGIEPGNADELAQGRLIHSRHGRAVLAAGVLKALAYGLLLVALVLLSAYLTLKLL